MFDEFLDDDVISYKPSKEMRDIIEDINAYLPVIERLGRKLGRISRKISEQPTERLLAKFERVEDKLTAKVEKREELIDSLIDIVTTPDWM